MDFEVKRGPWSKPEVHLQTVEFKHQCYTRETTSKDKPVADKPVADKPVADKPVANKPDKAIQTETLKAALSPVISAKPIIASKAVKSCQDFYDTFVRRTSEQCAVEANAPQRSNEWLEARRLCITASSFGSATGSNPYCSQRQLVLEKLWTTFAGNELTRYGTFHEQDAEDSLVVFLNDSDYVSRTYKKTFPESEFTSFCLNHYGLIKKSEDPWIAVSPDAVLSISGPAGMIHVLVEYKCPAGQRHYAGHPYERSNCVPEYYMDQIQGIMGLMGLGILECLFVVWQPEKTYITFVPFDQERFDRLYKQLKTWYFDLFLPKAYQKYLGHLVPNTVDTILNLDLLV